MVEEALETRLQEALLAVAQERARAFTVVRADTLHPKLQTEYILFEADDYCDLTAQLDLSALRQGDQCRLSVYTEIGGHLVRVQTYEISDEQPEPAFIIPRQLFPRGGQVRYAQVAGMARDVHYECFAMRIKD
jgi:hypothetical protein